KQHQERRPAAAPNIMEEHPLSPNNHIQEAEAAAAETKTYFDLKAHSDLLTTEQQEQQNEQQPILPELLHPLNTPKKNRSQHTMIDPTLDPTLATRTPSPQLTPANEEKTNDPIKETQAANCVLKKNREEPSLGSSQPEGQKSAKKRKFKGSEALEAQKELIKISHKKMAAMQTVADDVIMLKDLSAMDPISRAFYTAKKEEIVTYWLASLRLLVFDELSFIMFNSFYFFYNFLILLFYFLSKISFSQHFCDPHQLSK
ncbi:hypothetical protein MJO29_015187, partial [Puccinia striiformis f. sp. tritici]